MPIYTTPYFAIPRFCFNAFWLADFYYAKSLFLYKRNTIFDFRPFRECSWSVKQGLGEYIRANFMCELLKFLCHLMTLLFINRVPVALEQHYSFCCAQFQVLSAFVLWNRFSIQQCGGLSVSCCGSFWLRLRSGTTSRSSAR